MPSKKEEPSATVDRADSQITTQKKKTPDMKTEKKMPIDQQTSYTEEDVSGETQLKPRVKKSNQV